MRRLRCTVIVSLLAALLSATHDARAGKSGEEKASIKEFTDANFKRGIKKGVVVVDFWAVWCGPCRKQGPVVDEAAYEARKVATFGKLDIDKNPFVADLYQINSIPTIIIYKDGEVVKRFVGLTTKEEIIAAVREIAAK